MPEIFKASIDRTWRLHYTIGLVQSYGAASPFGLSQKRITFNAACRGIMIELRLQAL
jgi:hypothetical protein